MSIFAGWHIVVLLGVLAVIALAIGLLLFAVYWIARAGARRGEAERASGLEDGPHEA